MPTTARRRLGVMEFHQTLGSRGTARRVRSLRSRLATCGNMSAKGVRPSVSPRRIRYAANLVPPLCGEGPVQARLSNGESAMDRFPHRGFCEDQFFALLQTGTTIDMEVSPRDCVLTFGASNERGNGALLVYPEKQ